MVFGGGLGKTNEKFTGKNGRACVFQKAKAEWVSGNLTLLMIACLLSVENKNRERKERLKVSKIALYNIFSK